MAKNYAPRMQLRLMLEDFFSDILYLFSREASWVPIPKYMAWQLRKRKDWNSWTIHMQWGMAISKTTIPSTQIPNILRFELLSIICFILAAFRLTWRLGLPEKLRLPPLCQSSPLQEILPLQFLVSKTKTPFGPKTMWSISPPPLRRYKSFRR